ncbi:XRE family transcriptional regulator [Levilactobacillus brevis]|uniref:helix-turn-helix domain-containing protein n=1 Tax=Levilactobacillus brevis TaxID=1580 RepID=UPI0021A2EA1A|nr:helix-turn-helix transcriptional regulator [Levilactobacillus brevis]MCT3567230.1 XRE family transcriptional regulator [Levilactobacillus brevis]
MKPGTVIASLRNSQKWSQPALAQKMNVSQSTVAMWESGKRNISNEDLLKLADLFNVTTDYLLGRTTIKNGNASSLEPQAAHKRDGLTAEQNKQVDDYIKFLNSLNDNEK